MNTEMSQVELHKDQCTCRACGVKGYVAVAPELKENKWMCRNCNLIQLWVPSKEYMAYTASEQQYKYKEGLQQRLFSASPFVGLGQDGCLTGVYEDTSNVQMIVLVAVGLALLGIVVEYYRQKMSEFDDNERHKASNIVPGVDDWNRQRPIVSLSAMSKARSVARD